MLSVERKNQILSILQVEKKVVVKDLAEKFSVSEETIRRDLEKLENSGLVVKAYGGAVLNESTKSEMPLYVRKRTNVFGKEKIAELVSSLIKDNTSLMLDGSTTAYFISKRIKDLKNMTVITNSIEILIELKDIINWNIYCTGGLMKEGSLTLLGSETENMIAGYHVNTGVVSCKGFDMNGGITDPNEIQAATKRAIVSHADNKILAVDSTKFNTISFKKICEFSDINTVVTDMRPSDEWLEFLDRKNIDCIYMDK